MVFGPGELGKFPVCIINPPPSDSRVATTDEERADLLQLGRNWLKLARSYEAVAVEFGLGLG
jgi:hypothetical protein